MKTSDQFLVLHLGMLIAAGFMITVSGITQNAVTALGSIFILLLSFYMAFMSRETFKGE